MPNHDPTIPQGVGLQPGSLRSVQRPLLVVLEGPYDVEFFKRISAILHADDPSIPSLANLECNRQIIFIPLGGASLVSCIGWLGSLGHPLFLLVDSETPPETERRRKVLGQVASGDMVVRLTSHRSTENYLYAKAVNTACGVEIEFGDHDDVVELVAMARYRQRGSSVPWERIAPTRRRGCRKRAKRTLNLRATELMTPELLTERDPDGEVVG